MLAYSIHLQIEFRKLRLGIKILEEFVSVFELKKKKETIKMSFLKKMFSKKKNKEVSTEETINKIVDTESLLKKKMEFLEEQLEEQLKIAKQNATTNKRGEFYRCLLYGSVHKENI